MQSPKQKVSNKILSLRSKLQKNKEELMILKQSIEEEEEDLKKKKEREENRVQKIVQKKIDIGSEIIIPNTEEDSFSMKLREWDSFGFQNLSIKMKKKTISEFYPPSCSGYDMTYCKFDDAIYVYGGISCNSVLREGLKQYFYKLKNEVWTQVKPVSIYIPMPRYGHTLTAYHDNLFLLGGVSEYKEKLRDRCFYSDLWSYSISKNNWKLYEFTGPLIKNRKNHTSCIYQKYYLIYGGIDDSEEVITTLSWTIVEDKKNRWRSKKVEGKYNHKMSILQTQLGHDYLFVYGGRSVNSIIVNDFLVFPISVFEGELNVREPSKISHSLLPRQLPILCQFQSGLLIMGGIDHNNEVLNDCWFYSGTKQQFEKIQIDLDWNELRGCKGVSLNKKKIYLLSGGTSVKYKAIEFWQ